MKITRLSSNSTRFHQAFLVIGAAAFLLPLVIFGYSMSNSAAEKSNKVKPLIVIKDANRPGLSFDGKRVNEGPEIGLTEVYDVDTGKKLGTYKVKDSESEALSADGKRVRIFGKGRHITYDIDSGEIVSQGSIELTRDGVPFGSVQILGDGGMTTKNISSDLSLVGFYFLPRPYSIAGAEFPELILGNLENNTLVRQFRTVDSYIPGDEWEHIAMTPDAKVIAASRNNIKDTKRRKAVIWNAETGEVVLEIPNCKIQSLSDDGKRIAVQNFDDSSLVEFWDIPSGKMIAQLSPVANGRTIPVNRSMLSPDGKLFVTTRGDNFYFWSAETGRFIVSQKQDDVTSGGDSESIAFSGDGKRIAIGSDNEVVTVWAVEDILKKAK